MFDQVFISHAKEDYGVAEKLYDYLSDNGYSPWLDKKSIRIGEDWDYAIKKAPREATFVILLLSSTSVQKRGYIQKEFGYALEYSETKLVDDIYLIPILLDNCDVPQHLKKFQWAEINKDNAMDEILSSLNIQRTKYLDTLSPDEISINDYTTISIALNARTTRSIDYSCKLPLFNKNRHFDSNLVNIFIQQIVEYDDLRSFINDCILRYGDTEQRRSLLNYTEHVTEDNLNFIFSKETLQIEFANVVPRVILALSSLEIPIIDLGLRKHQLNHV